MNDAQFLNFRAATGNLPMRIIFLALLLLSLQVSHGATLLTVPIQQPSQEIELSSFHRLAFNFETGEQAVTISSFDIAVATLPGGLSATLYSTSVFDPSSPSGIGTLAVSMTHSSVFPGGVSFEFPDTLGRV